MLEISLSQYLTMGMKSKGDAYEKYIIESVSKKKIVAKFKSTLLSRPVVQQIARGVSFSGGISPVAV